MNPIHRVCVIVLCAVGSGLPPVLFAADATTTLPFVHPLFADNMVMPRDVAAPVWGWSPSGSRVTVAFGGQTATGVADASGRWSVKIGPIPAGGPHTMTIAGPETVTVKNVLVGDIWLCSGQSNMHFPVKSATGADQISAGSDLPQVRLFPVQTRPAADEQCTFKEPQAWRVCSPDAVKDFSAVAYCFGRDLHQHLKVPIGLIHTSAGATTIEAWSSVAALESVPGGDRDIADLAEWKNLLAEWDHYDADPAHYQKLMGDWYLKNDPGSATEPGWADPKLEKADWKTLLLPGTWQKELPGFEGVVWFHKAFDLPTNLAGKDVVLFLGPMDRRDTVWINGEKIGQSDSNGWVRQYKVSRTLLSPTHNHIVVRVLGSSGLVGTPDQLSLRESTAPGAVSLPLAGAWQYRIGVRLKDATRPPSLRSGNPSIPGALFNGAISPLAPFAIKGVVWYQGESNTNNPVKYARSLPAMIKDWRSRFVNADFPFLIVQLPGFGDTHSDPVTSQWALFRESQAAVARSTPACGLVTTIDLGEPKDVHPRNKLEVGRRLALLAEATVYGEPTEYSGPVFQSMTTDGDSVTVHCCHTDGLTTSDGKTPCGFAVAGEDKHFFWADAVIDGSRIILSSAQVPQPVAVRYSWDDTPKANLINAAHLPAVPFRTDKW